MRVPVPNLLGLFLMTAMTLIVGRGESAELKAAADSQAVSQYLDFFKGEEVNVGKTVTWNLHVRKMSPKAKNVMGTVARPGFVVTGFFSDTNSYSSTTEGGGENPSVLTELTPGSGLYVILHSGIIGAQLQRKLEEGDVFVVKGWVARRSEYQPDKKDETVKFRALVLQPEEAVYLHRVTIITPTPIEGKASPETPTGSVPSTVSAGQTPLPEPPPFEVK